MSLRSWFEKIAVFVPAPLVAWLNEWQGLLQKTGLSHPHWRHQANNLTIVIAIVLVLTLYVLLHNRAQRVIANVAICAGALSLLALAICLWVRHSTGQAATQAAIEAWKLYWSIAYVTMATTWLSAITVFALWLSKHKPAVSR